MGSVAKKDLKIIPAELPLRMGSVAKMKDVPLRMGSVANTETVPLRMGSVAKQKPGH